MDSLRRWSLAGSLVLLAALPTAAWQARTMAADAAAAEAPASARDPLADLAWLAGCWVPLDGEEGSLEQWTAPAGGSMLGVSRTVKNGRAVAHEFLHIRQVGADGVEYVARPSGQDGAVFTMVRQAPGEVVFENPGHDFPQRIIYRLGEAGRLLASIEGEVNGRLKQVPFPMRPVACPSAR